MSLKRILFITNNFPPVTCGVGDYTYKLAQELVKQGCEVSVLCSFKPEIKQNVKNLRLEGIEVFSLVKTWDNKGLNPLQSVFKDKQFDWVSLQYVPFSFEKRGLPLGLAKNLKMLFLSAKWHIMFHELWVGMYDYATLRLKLQGYAQKFLIKTMLIKLQPDVIHSHSEIYLSQLKKMGYAALKLPLFSNVSKNSQIVKKEDKSYVLFTLFGGIKAGVPVSQFINELNTVFLNTGEKEIVFSFVGKNGQNIDIWIEELKALKIRYKIHGVLTEKEISQILKTSDYGITTTPYLLTEKSGGVAAMIQHGLKVISVSRDWSIKEVIKDEIKINGVKQYKKNNLNNIISSNWDQLVYENVKLISIRLMTDLNY
jgi:glycosyltransferase involved in cell wall biosynthesis